MLSRYRGGEGWEPVVFCVHEHFHEQSLDPELARLVSQDARVIKIGAIPQRIARRFGLGDIGLLPEMDFSLVPKLTRDPFPLAAGIYQR